MNDPNPGSKEATFSISAWVIFVIGAGFVSVGKANEWQKEGWAEAVATNNVFKAMGHAGTTTTSLSFEEMEKRLNTNYTPIIELGLVLIIVALGCSLYANKLRKARTGG
jgi:hypothetical protein